MIKNKIKLSEKSLGKDTRIVKCLICDNEMLKRTSKKSHQRASSIKSSRCNVCSTKCSNKYNLIYEYCWRRIKSMEKKNVMQKMQ